MPRRNLSPAATGLAAAGKAIIVVQSELPEVLRLIHRIAVMCGAADRHPARRRPTSQNQIMNLATPATPQKPARPRMSRPGPDRCAGPRRIASGAQQRSWPLPAWIVLVAGLLAGLAQLSANREYPAILQATSVNGVLAIAATLVIITGGIDLSVGHADDLYRRHRRGDA